MKFLSTRDSNLKAVNFSQAMLNPATNGLYVPQKLPKLPNNFFYKNMNANYKDFALEIFKLFNFDISENLLKDTLAKYDTFDTKKVCPLSKLNDDLFILELFHGQSKAFKDMALTPFGYLFSQLSKQQSNKNNKTTKHKQYLIAVATSGDTGPATLNAFKDCDNIKVVCIYPNGGTSDIQKLQMISDNDPNHFIFAINGNFDDAQSALKELLSGSDFNAKLKQKNISLSVANSVNFGRIAFQIIYHINTYAKLLAQKEITQHDFIKIIVPSGNFGNALGAYYAKKMGVNISKIAICTNENNILSEFINTGIYDLRNKKLIKTSSPAMDILKSSNVERVLYEMFGDKRVNELMISLEQNNFYKLTKNELKILQESFEAYESDDNYCQKIIAKYFHNGYIMDTHTATGFKAYDCKANSTNTSTNAIEVNVICSTAHWGKFAPFVAKALGKDNLNDKKASEFISTIADIKMPKFISELLNKQTKEPKILDTKNLQNEIIKLLDN
jgi:threonine synthase